MRHIIPVTLVIVLIASTAALASLTPPEQFIEFLTLLIPACVVTGLFLVTHYIPLKARQPRNHSKLKRAVSGAIKAINLLIAVLLLVLFVSNIAGVFALYAFSQDHSFNDWRYGYPSYEAITQLRPVGTNDDNFTGERGRAEPNTPDPTDFFQRVEYFKRLREGPIRPIAIENIEAIKEARRILSPLRSYVAESGNAHGIQPDVIATFILVNRMIRAEYLTYDFRTGLAHALWHRRFFPEQRNMYDLSPLTNRSEVARLLNRLLPVHLKLQDRAGDFLGGLIIGANPTIGNMQIRATAVPYFENERNVTGYNLWARFDFDASGLTARQINWLLLTDARLDIEAGTTALRQSIDMLIDYQTEGKIGAEINLTDMNSDWFFYNVPEELQSYGPDLILTTINDNRWVSQEPEPKAEQGSELSCQLNLKLYDFTHDRKILTITEADYPLFHVIAMEAGVFDDIPGIIVGVITPEQVDYLYEIASGEDSYLREAALRSLEVLAGDEREDISESAKGY